MSIPLEDLTSSLVREFLHKKKCLQTLKLLDEEWPRTESSISSRAKLAEALHIESWVDRNKSNNPKLKTMLEVILYNIVQMNDLNKKVIASASSVQYNAPKNHTDNYFNDVDAMLKTSLVLDQPYAADGEADKQISKKEFNEKNLKPTTITAFSGNQDDGVNIFSLPKANSTPKINDLSRCSNNSSLKTSILGDGAMFTKLKSTLPNQNNKTSDLHSSSLDELLCTITKKKSNSNSVEILDLEETNSFFASGSAKSSRITFSSNEKTVSNNVSFSYDVAKSLRTLIFGSSKVAFMSEWSDQNFLFCNCHDRPKELRFGIIQKKGGPCGVLASVQATVLKYILFENGTKSRTESCLDISDADRTRCLVNAVTEMIWRAGQCSHATLAILTRHKQFTGFLHEYRPDGVTEFVATLNFITKSDLHAAVREHINVYEKGRGACILLLYSTILSRGIDTVKNDMDEPMGKLMGAHNYCTQEMINLLLTGQATSNAFDNTIQLDKLTLLKGVHAQSDIGLLSLFEHYGSCKIGEFYKTPKYPIWLVCSESHFTVLFGFNMNLVSNDNHTPIFDLYYYDGLANQDEIIKLTVNTSAVFSDKRLNVNLIPPLEHCIRTKWSKAAIDWNDTEPLL